MDLSIKCENMKSCWKWNIAKKLLDYLHLHFLNFNSLSNISNYISTGIDTKLRLQAESANKYIKKLVILMKIMLVLLYDCTTWTHA